MTVPGNVSKIVGIMAVVVIQTATAGEGAVGVVRLTSENVEQLNPYIFPCDVQLGPAGTLADIGPGVTDIKIIPCDIAVKEKDVIMVEAKLTLAQTGTCNAIVGFLFE